MWCSLSVPVKGDTHWHFLNEDDFEYGFERDIESDSEKLSSILR